MKLNIRLKFIAFTFCTVLLVGGAISLYSIYQGRQQVMTTFEKNARKITTLIAGTIADDLYFLDLHSLRLWLENARVNPDISYTYVTDLQGVVLADGTGKNALRDQKLSDTFSRGILLSDGWISRVEGEILKVGGPVIMADGSRIGYLQVGFSLGAAGQIVRDTTRTSLYIIIIAICLGLGAILAVILSITFTRPIRHIAQASREIGEGKLDTRLHVKKGDELGLLAESINQMAVNLNRNLERVTALRDINLATTSTLHLRTVLNVLLEKIDLFLPYSAATVRLFNKESGLLEPIACRNLDEKEWREQRLKAGHGLANVAFETKAPVVIGNIQTDPRSQTREFFHRHGLVSYLGVPLIVKGEILGILGFYTKEEHEFSDEEVEFLTTLAGQAAIAIYNSQLYEESKKQAVELEKANKVKSEFLSVMSHELRTPLNVVVGYVGMIHDRMLGDISPEQEKALGKVISRSNDLLVMITSILEATKIEADAVKVESHEVNLKDFFDELRSAHDAPLDKELTLNWDYPSDHSFMKTDSRKLKHILENLINNAIKFTANGHVRISARCLDGIRTEAGKRQQAIGNEQKAGGNRQQFMEFKVADTGIGICQESLPFIFEMFRQADGSETRPYGGVGMGLYIVKKFTEMLGGKVEVESKPGKGSTFTVMIPYEH